MADLIDRQAAINALHDWGNSYRWDDSQFFDVDDVVAPGDVIRELPSVEPERKNGKWQITDAYPHNVYCSECHTKFAQTHWAVWEDGSLPRNFCPNCGAKMEGEE